MRDSELVIQSLSRVTKHLAYIVPLLQSLRRLHNGLLALRPPLPLPPALHPASGQYCIHSRGALYVSSCSPLWLPLRQV